jgi:hypothetical protein
LDEVQESNGSEIQWIHWKIAVIPETKHSSGTATSFDICWDHFKATKKRDAVALHEAAVVAVGAA